MTENDFRIKHSELIQYYQLIEMRLKFACAGLLADEEKGWFDRLDDYESDPFGVLIQKINSIQKEKKITIFTKEDNDELDEMRKKRNYWVHQCFGGQCPVTFSRGEVRRPMHASSLVSDLNQAIEWDKKLTELARNDYR